MYHHLSSTLDHEPDFEQERWPTTRLLLERPEEDGGQGHSAREPGILSRRCSATGLLGHEGWTQLLAQCAQQVDAGSGGVGCGILCTCQGPQDLADQGHA